MVPAARRDLIANYAGRATSVLAGLVVLPLYRDLLGPERFGVVAFFAMIQSLLATLDAGLGAAFLQRISRTRGEPGRQHELPDVVATFAALAGALAVATAALLSAFAPLVPSILRVEPEIVTETASAGVAMAGVLAAWWPTTLLQGALLHLGRQPESSMMGASFAVLRAVATYVILKWVDASLLGYALPQAGLGLLQALVLLARVRAALPDGQLGSPRGAMLRAELPAALALGTASLLGILGTNVDRAALTALRPVAELGTYGFATIAVTAVTQISAPVLATYYPRLCEANTPRSRESVYLEAHRVALALALPIALSLAAHSHTVLLLWTRDPIIEAEAGPALAILSLAVAFTAAHSVVVSLAYALQRAADVARIQGAAAVLHGIVCPLLVWRWGILGAALSNLFMHFGLSVVIALRTHGALEDSATSRRWLATMARIAVPMVVIALVGGAVGRASEDLAVRTVTALVGGVASALVGLRALRDRHAAPSPDAAR